MVTEGWIVGVVSAVLALVLELVPWVRVRWDALSWESKRFGWLVGCVLVSTTPVVTGCVTERLGVDATSVSFVGTCSVDTLAAGLQIGFMAYFASQAVHGAARGVKQVVASKEGNGG